MYSLSISVGLNTTWVLYFKSREAANAALDKASGTAAFRLEDDYGNVFVGVPSQINGGFLQDLTAASKIQSDKLELIREIRKKQPGAAAHAAPVNLDNFADNTWCMDGSMIWQTLKDAGWKEIDRNRLPDGVAVLMERPAKADAA